MKGDAVMTHGVNPMIDKARDVKRDLTDLGSMAVDAARDKATQMKDKVVDAYEEGCAQAKNIQNQGENYIKANPVKSVLIAGAVGVAIGWFLSRRSK
jgi:ElaB/YqjD/DUF883 family membrane-anchored ribosome-binding protein